LTKPASNHTSLDQLRRLRGLFETTDNVLVIINADPDALASAKALKRLLWRRVHSVKIARLNDMRRPDNLTMVRVLEIPTVKLSQVRLDEFQRLVLLDSQPHHAPALAGLSYDAVIDHHPVGPEIQAAFQDVRPEYGANASIMTEYLRVARIKPAPSLATALFYGIKTDTETFRRTAFEADMEAAAFLFPLTNAGLLRQIEYAEMSLADLKYYQEALARMTFRRRSGSAFVHMGALKNADVLVQLADFFMRVHSVGWSFVSGVVDGKLIVIARNDAYRKDAGKLMAKTFGQLGSAGGHKAAARAEVPLAHLPPRLAEADVAAWQRFVIRTIEGNK
jgi:nanoRNase/pAp phosphatase (c-di-AMP/oligoRNAs hydrolase)